MDSEEESTLVSPSPPAASKGATPIKVPPVKDVPVSEDEQGKAPMTDLRKVVTPKGELIYGMSEPLCQARQ